MQSSHLLFRRRCLRFCFIVVTAGLWVGTAPTLVVSGRAALYKYTSPSAHGGCEEEETAVN